MCYTDLYIFLCQHIEQCKIFLENRILNITGHIHTRDATRKRDNHFFPRCRKQNRYFSVVIVI